MPPIRAAGAAGPPCLGRGHGPLLPVPSAMVEPGQPQTGVLLAPHRLIAES